MAHKKSTSNLAALESLISEDRDLIRELIHQTVQQVLDAEMTEFLGAAPVNVRGSVVATEPVFMAAVGLRG